MVKNIPTIERSTKIRFGKNVPDSDVQAENTIVFNASNTLVTTPNSGSIYMSPVRFRPDFRDENVVLMMYNRITGELSESGESANALLGGQTFQVTTDRGNTTSNVVQFINPEVSFVTFGNVGIANTIAGHTLDVGSNLYVDDLGANVLVVSGGVSIDGNLVVTGGVTTITTENLKVKDAIIELGLNNTSEDTTLDLGLIMTRPESNVTVGFREDSDELILAYTESSAESNTIVPLTSETLDVHVYGRVFTESNVGIINTSPEHTLDVGSNLYVDEYGSNVLVVTGNTSITGDLTVDTDVLRIDSTNNKIGINTVLPDAELHVVGNVYASSNLTVDIDTFHVDVEADHVGINTKYPDAELHVVGNVYASSNLTVDVDTLHVDVEADHIGINTKYPDAELHVVGNVYASSNLTVDVDTLHVDVEADHVGINTKYPDAELHVVGNVYASSNLTVDTDTFHVDVEADHIGINTKYPDAELHVVGNAYVTNTLKLDDPTTALITDLTANVEVKLNQLANVIIDTTDVNDSLRVEHTLVYDGANWYNDYPKHTYVKIFNDSGGSLAQGSAVYIKGSHNANVLEVGLARADSPDTMPVFGIVAETIAEQGGEGIAVTYGKALTTSVDAFIEGETVYVSNVVAGGLSNVKPFYTDSVPNLIQNVGVVTKSGRGQGAIFVTGIGRANDIPNAQIVLDETAINWVYVNDANNDFKKIEPSNLLTQLQTLQQVTDTGNTTSNTIQFTNVTTGLVTVSNVEVGSNISVMGLTDPQKKYLTMVNQDGFLQKSPVYVDKDTGVYVIEAAEAEFQGNLTLSGNTTILNSESVTISDRIFGVGANNSASQLDSGFMIEHQEGDPLEYANVALIYHADEHRFSISYTQNTFTDNHILHY